MVISTLAFDLCGQTAAQTMSDRMMQAAAGRSSLPKADKTILSNTIPLRRLRSDLGQMRSKMKAIYCAAKHFLRIEIDTIHESFLARELKKSN
jgi:hypothetical protein